MLTKEVFVRGRSVYANGDVTLIRTSIGVYDMHVLFDAAEWLDFPVKVVFGYGAEQVTQTLVLTALTSDEWAAEATVEIPWEVMAQLGTVRVTFQGTDSTGGTEKHIITAMSGGLWSVAEEGDVTDGTVPTPAPTEDEWNQAFEAAMIAANDASSAAVAANNAAVSANTQAVRAEAAAEAAEGIVAGDIATTERAGIVKPDGTTITVEEDGTISAVSALGTPDWDEANSSANDFIKNRPFGRFAGTWATLYDQSGITLNTTEYLYPDNVKFGKVDGFTIDGSAIVGKSYSVTLDGTLTQCVAEVGTVEMVDESLPRGQTVTVRGAMLTGDNFVILLPCAEASTEAPKAFVKGVTTTHSLKVAGSKVVLHTMPRQYLPVATSSAIGAVKVDNSTIEADANGSISVKAVPAAKLTGTISADNLPSYVDDVKEYATASDFPATGETGKIYVALDSNASYRWGGSAYVRVASGENATDTTDGLMSHADKAKLDAAPDSYGDGLNLTNRVLSLGPLTKSGQGSTVETDGCAIFGITGEGWAEQETTTGKNLLDISVAEIDSHNRCTYVNGINSLVLTRDTAGSFAFAGYKVSLAAEAAYTLSFSAQASNHYHVRVVCFDSSDVSLGDALSRIEQEVNNFTTLANTSYAIVYFLVGGAGGGGAVGDTATFSNPQLEPGDQDTSWEPYSGGQPSPRPDWAQPIKVCRGRNLLEVENKSASANGVTATGSSDGSVTLSGTATADAELYAVRGTYGYTNDLPVEPGTDCTASLSGYISGVTLTLVFFSSSERLLTVQGITSGTSFTVPASAKGMCALVKVANGTSTNITVYPQINTGSTPTPYVPFGHVGIEVQREDVSRVVFDGSDDENWMVDNEGLCIYKASVPDSYIGSSWSDTYTWCDDYATSQVANSSMVDKSIKEHYNISRIYLRDTRYATLDALKAALAANPITVYYLNNKHTGSVPAFPTTTTPVPLPSKGWAGATRDNSDALSIDSAGGYRWDVETAEKVLDGSESWAQLSTTESGKYRNYAAIPGMAGGFTATTTPDPDVMADRFMSIPNDYDAGGTRGCNVGMHRRTNGDALIVIYHEGETAADFSTWLSTHNVTLLYPLATPTTETGYIALPDLPLGAVVSCPELESIGVSWWIEGAEAIVEHAKAERAYIESIIAELATE